MSQPRFIHLRLHTEHSLLEGAVPVKKLIKLCEAAQMPAVAVTDSNNMFAALEFSVLAQGAGVQPIVGCQISVCYEATQPGEKARAPASVVLLAQNDAGYMNLMKLNTCLYIDGEKAGTGQLPQVTLAELERHAEGLICLTGGADGPLGRLFQTGQVTKAQALAAKLAAIYPDRLYVELQRHPGEGGRLPEAEALSERGMLELAYAAGLPIVATNDVYFPKSSMYEAHDALICIAEGAYVDQQQPRRRLTPQHYFKSESEMCALFADLPEALENTVEIARTGYVFSGSVLVRITGITMYNCVDEWAQMPSSQRSAMVGHELGHAFGLGHHPRHHGDMMHVGGTIGTQWWPSASNMQALNAEYR